MRRSFRFLSILMVILILFTGFGEFTSVQASKEENRTKVDRIAGKNRIETAIEISKKAYRDGQCESVVITGFSGEADALTGTMLASYLDAPILLTKKEQIEDILIDEFHRLGINTIYILGGENVVGKEVEDQLKEKYKVSRISGVNRAQTAVEISKFMAERLTQLQKKDEIFLAQGYSSLADALSIGPVSAKENIPILLTRKDKLPEESLEEIRSRKPSKITIIGGEGAVSKKVEKSLPSGIEIERIKGENRGETAVSIAKTYFDGSDNLILANGWRYVDALVGGHLAAKERIPIVLAGDKDIGDETLAYIWTNRLNVSLLGGEVSLSNKLVNKIRGIENPKPKFDPNKPENKDQLKRVIESKLKNRPNEMRINYYGRDIKDRQSAYDFIRGLAGGGSYTLASIDGLGVLVDNLRNPILIRVGVSYRETLEEEAYIDKEVKRIIEEIIKPGMSEYEKVEVINHYIVNNTRYSGSDDRSGQSLSVLLKTGAGVCNAYALAASRFLDEIDIENYFVVGEANNGQEIELHAWNKVKVDGRWYNLDTTWNHPEKLYGKQYAYAYFLNSDEEFKKSHTAHSENLPKCLDARYDGQYDGDYSGIEVVKWYALKYGAEIKLEKVLEREIEELEIERKLIDEEIQLEEVLEIDLKEIIHLEEVK